MTVVASRDGRYIEIPVEMLYDATVVALDPNTSDGFSFSMEHCMTCYCTPPPLQVTVSSNQYTPYQTLSTYLPMLR